MNLEKIFENVLRETDLGIWYQDLIDSGMKRNDAITYLANETAMKPEDIMIEIPQSINRNALKNAVDQINKW